jgi:hypothetical protein
MSGVAEETVLLARFSKLDKVSDKEFECCLGHIKYQLGNDPHPHA